MNVPEAWDTTTGWTQTIVAIVDSGVDLDRPDLQSKIILGYDFVNCDCNPGDNNGHGTRFAGIAAAATNNATNVAGKDWNTKILPVKMTGSNGTGGAATIALGIIFAADEGADITNLSLGRYTPAQQMQNAVAYA